MGKLRCRWGLNLSTTRRVVRKGTLSPVPFIELKISTTAASFFHFPCLIWSENLLMQTAPISCETNFSYTYKFKASAHPPREKSGEAGRGTYTHIQDPDQARLQNSQACVSKCTDGTTKRNKQAFSQVCASCFIWAGPQHYCGEGTPSGYHGEVMAAILMISPENSLCLTRRNNFDGKRTGFQMNPT